MRTLGNRLLAWMLLLILGVAAIVGGIVVAAHGYQNKLVIIDSGDGGLANFVLCFISIAIGFALYLLRGFSTKMWSPPIAGVLFCLGYALALLAFGARGLFVLAGAGIVVKILGKATRKSKRQDDA